MSRPISESLSLLSETLGNCKNNLKEKEVADVDNIKISDVDEKIAEIQAGGGGSSLGNPEYIESVTYNGQKIEPIGNIFYVKGMIWENDSVEITFKVKNDCYAYLPNDNKVTIDSQQDWVRLQAGDEKKIITYRSTRYYSVMFCEMLETYLPPNETPPDQILIGMGHEREDM